MANGYRTPLLLVTSLLLVACAGDPGTGPVEVKWDRTACDRCRMVLSDRHHAAQVRVFPEGRRSQVHDFDDIGCAVLWLEGPGAAWAGQPQTEIWVKDFRDQRWIDARTATYRVGQLTPMEYGLGAQAEAAPDGLDFAAAARHIHSVEERFNTHSAQLRQRLRQQAARRAAPSE